MQLNLTLSDGDFKQKKNVVEWNTFCLYSCCICDNVVRFFLIITNLPPTRKAGQLQSKIIHPKLNISRHWFAHSDHLPLWSRGDLQQFFLNTKMIIARNKVSVISCVALTDLSTICQQQWALHPAGSCRTPQLCKYITNWNDLTALQSPFMSKSRNKAFLLINQNARLTEIWTHPRSAQHNILCIWNFVYALEKSWMLHGVYNKAQINEIEEMRL